MVTVAFSEGQRDPMGTAEEKAERVEESAAEHPNDVTMSGFALVTFKVDGEHYGTRRGTGTLAVNYFKALADKHNVRILGNPDASLVAPGMTGSRPGQADLERFYRKRGFKPWHEYRMHEFARMVNGSEHNLTTLTGVKRSKKGDTYTGFEDMQKQHDDEDPRGWSVPIAEARYRHLEGEQAEKAVRRKAETLVRRETGPELKARIGSSEGWMYVPPNYRAPGAGKPEQSGKPQSEPKPDQSQGKQSSSKTPPCGPQGRAMSLLSSTLRRWRSSSSSATTSRPSSTSLLTSTSK